MNKLILRKAMFASTGLCLCPILTLLLFTEYLCLSSKNMTIELFDSSSISIDEYLVMGVAHGLLEVWILCHLISNLLRTRQNDILIEVNSPGYIFLEAGASMSQKIKYKELYIFKFMFGQLFTTRQNIKPNFGNQEILHIVGKAKAFAINHFIFHPFIYYIK